MGIGLGRLGGIAGKVARRGRSVAARRQHPHVTVTSGPLTGTHASGVLEFLDTNPLRQPDNTTCGPSCLVLDRMLHDADYGNAVLAAQPPADTFGRDVKALHRRAGLPVDLERHPQLPWPRALGTRPAAAARILSEKYGAPGTRYGRYVVDPDDPGKVLDTIVGTVSAGEPVVAYIGNAVTPRHVVLFVGTADDALRCYDPSSGSIVDVSHESFTAARLQVAGWDIPWLALLPR